MPLFEPPGLPIYSSDQFESQQLKPEKYLTLIACVAMIASR